MSVKMSLIRFLTALLQSLELLSVKMSYQIYDFMSVKMSPINWYVIYPISEFMSS